MPLPHKLIVKVISASCASGARLTESVSLAPDTAKHLGDGRENLGNTSVLNSNDSQKWK